MFSCTCVLVQVFQHYFDDAPVSNEKTIKLLAPSSSSFMCCDGSCPLSLLCLCLSPHLPLSLFRFLTLTHSTGIHRNHSVNALDTHARSHLQGTLTDFPHFQQPRRDWSLSLSPLLLCPLIKTPSVRQNGSQPRQTPRDIF